jgi:AraC family transcriptional regulator
MPLDRPPSVRQIAIGAHGKKQAVDVYQLDFWCLHVYRYNGELSIDERAFPIRPGFASVTPPGARLEYRYKGRSVHAYAHFVLADAAGPRTAVPAMQDLGVRFEGVNRLMEEAIGFFPVQPRRAEARVWDILWLLSETSPAGAAGAPPLHPALRKAVELIELGLGGRLRAEELAQQVSLSHTHLTRLFHAQLGQTVIGYITRRRMARAQHLLEHSDLPIKAIAAEIGIPDLHLFNKTVRRVLGAPPRKIRMGRMG